jgi:hypothetical protein
VESIYRPLAGFTMLTAIGDLGQPLPYLAIHVVKIGKLT